MIIITIKPQKNRRRPIIIITTKNKVVEIAYLFQEPLFSSTISILSRNSARYPSTGWMTSYNLQFSQPTLVSPENNKTHYQKLEISFPRK
jgi:hypothetical protein